MTSDSSGRLSLLYSNAVAYSRFWRRALLVLGPESPTNGRGRQQLEVLTHLT